MATLEEINLLFDTLKDTIKDYTSSKTIEELYDEGLGFVLVKVNPEDTDVTFSGGPEQACRAILGILKAFDHRITAKIMMIVTGELLDRLEEERKKDFPLPVKPTKSVN